MEQEGGALVRYVAAIFRKKVLVLGVAGFVLAITIFVAVMTPKKYGSTMNILVQNARALPVISSDRLSPMQAAATGSDAMETQINSEVELLQSNDLLEGLVRYRDRLHGLKPAPEGSLLLAHEVMELQRNIEIAPIRKTNFVQINFKDADPQLAQKSLQWLSTAFLDKHASLRRPAGTYKFFTDQAELSDQQLKEAEKKLIDFQLANNVVSLSTQKSMALTEYNRITQEISEAKVNLKDSQSRQADLDAQMKSTNGRITTQIRNSPDSYSIGQLSTLLVTLTNRRTELLTRFQPTEPQVQEVEKQIASTQEAILRANSPKAVETTLDNNPVHLTLEQDFRKAQADSHGQIARATTLQMQADAEKARIDGLEKISLEEDSLERNVQELKQNHETYLQKRDEAQIDDSLDAHKIVDVSIAQEPTISMLPVQPHPKTMIALGVVVACFCSLACVFIVDTMRQVAYTPAELESITGFSVLATIPETRTIAKEHLLSPMLSSPTRVAALEPMSPSLNRTSL